MDAILPRIDTRMVDAVRYPVVLAVRQRWNWIDSRRCAASDTTLESPAPPAAIIAQARSAPTAAARSAAQATAPGLSILAYLHAEMGLGVHRRAAGRRAVPAAEGAGGRGIPPWQLFVNCMSVWELISHYVENGQNPAQ
jgi:hypothetical protein